MVIASPVAPVQLPVLAPAAPIVAGAPMGSVPLPGTIPPGTPVRLMVMNEVTSRYARVGDRFKLRVDEDVTLAGAAVIPVGATAWGEVTSLDKSGAVGKRGSLAARLLYVEMPAGRVPLQGERVDRGNENTAGVVLAVVGFGPLGLLNRGNNAKLKAGDLFTGYTAAEPPVVQAAALAPTR